jgi:hypothetical protein
MINITSEHGYIGPLWWINSQPSERHPCLSGRPSDG